MSEYLRIQYGNSVDKKVPTQQTFQASQPVRQSITLTSAGWNSSKQQAVTVSGVLADETKQLIIPTPYIADQTLFEDAGIKCIGQVANKLTFEYKGDTKPASNIRVYVVIIPMSN